MVFVDGAMISLQRRLHVFSETVRNYCRAGWMADFSYSGTGPAECQT